MATLYVVATPIGNLKDISQRALEVLSAVAYVACEDTRVSLKLFNHFNLKKKLVSHYSYNEDSSAKKILELLGSGHDVALVSDSGTPCISDPGTLIVRQARKQGFFVVPIPGPSALSALISVSGLSAKGVSFEGFLSPKKGRRRNQLKILLERENSVILYESPFRVIGLFEDIVALEPEREVVIGREMTKMHEEFFFGTAKDVLTQLKEKPKIMGEFSLMIASRKKVKELESM